MQKSKKQTAGPLAAGAPCHGTNGTMVYPVPIAKLNFDFRNAKIKEGASLLMSNDRVSEIFQRWQIEIRFLLPVRPDGEVADTEYF